MTHCSAAARPLLADLAAGLLVDVDIAVAVVMHSMAVSAVMVDAMSAFVLDLMLVAVVMMAAMPFMRPATGGSLAARRPIGARLRAFAFGMTAMLALSMTAGLEVFGFVFGFAHFGAALGVIFVDLLGLAAASMATTPHMRAATLLFELFVRRFHLFHRTIPFQG